MRLKPTANEIVHSSLISAAAASIYYYWFGVCDRKALFLYGHLGFRPFDDITTGRYWMTGLVFSAFVSAAYYGSNYLLVLMNRRKNLNYAIPNLTHVWLLIFPAVLIGVPFITMTVNEPVMPLRVAFSIALILEAGLALGLFTATNLINDARGFLINLTDGLGIVPPLILIRTLELPGIGLMRASSAWFIAGGSVLFPLIWFTFTTFFFNRFRFAAGSAAGILRTGFFIAYLALPLAHFIFTASMSSPYISASGNFFPESHLLKLVTWLVVSFIAVFVIRFRSRLAKTGRSVPP